MEHTKQDDDLWPSIIGSDGYVKPDWNILLQFVGEKNKQLFPIDMLPHIKAFGFKYNPISRSMDPQEILVEYDRYNVTKLTIDYKAKIVDILAEPIERKLFQQEYLGEMPRL